MTLLGIGEKIRRRRVKKYRENDMLVNAVSDNVTAITTGSKAEGLTCLNESDCDILFVPNSVLCVEAGVNLHTIPEDIEMFITDTRVYPGHCRMLFKRPSSTRVTNRYIYTALCDDGQGNVLLSSALFLDRMVK
ncbi:hypothetical protein DPMN_092818 [Dreissena polymorpha]|uniref:Uncharacterized protein n=1 Tax=Dreissena polymorpha TaxID=45954 RepID=A0A9D4L4D9_DREPO|nr:hypothetical protein DPMN_092818 [Dreissena polymorpha]